MQLTYQQIDAMPKADVMHNALLIMDYIQHNGGYMVFDGLTCITMDGNAPPPCPNGKLIQINLPEKLDDQS